MKKNKILLKIFPLKEYTNHIEIFNFSFLFFSNLIDTLKLVSFDFHKPCKFGNLLLKSLLGILGSFQLIVPFVLTIKEKIN